MTADPRAAAEALVAARKAVDAAKSDREEVLTEPEWANAFLALRGADARIAEAKRAVETLEADVREAIENAWLEAEQQGEPLELPPGLGVQWRHEPTYEDGDAVRWIRSNQNGPWGGESLSEALYAWMLDCVVKHRSFLNKIIMKYRPDFADTTATRLVPTVSADLAVKLAGDYTAADVRAAEADDRREHGEAIRKLVTEQWGKKP